MDFQPLLNKYSPFLKRHLLPIALGLVGLIFFAYGLIGLFLASKTSSDDIIFEASSGKNSIELETIFVDIEGAVIKPGLYKLPYDSRIQNGLVAAGGLSAQADREYIAKNLNLAIKLTDGAKIYIPSVGEAVRRGGVLNSSQMGTFSGLVNVNSSSQSQLEALPGVGPVTAQKIMGGRPYGSIDELLSKKIVGSKIFGQIKDKITVY